MQTWWIIARKEVGDHLRNERSLLTLLVSALLITVSFFLLVDDYEQRKLSYDRRDMVGQTRAGKRPKLTAPPSNLSVLARGLEAHTGRLLLITWSQPRRQPGAAVLDQGDQNPLFSLFSAPDFIHIVKFFLSLVALFFAYDSICGERHRGTLRLVFAGPVGRSAFLVGKLVGMLLSFLLCLAPALVLVVGGLGFSTQLALGGEDWLRIGGIFLLSLLYVGLFLHLGLWMSAIISRPATALLLLLCIWTVWVIGVPNLAMPLGRWLRSFPAVEEIEAEKSQLRQGDFDSYLDYASACWAVDDRYIAQVDRQIEFTRVLSRLSPMAAYTYGATALARTGVEDAQRFRDAVVHWDRNQRRSGYHWQDKIPFIYEFRNLEQSWEATLPDLVILVLWNVFFLSAAIFSFVHRNIA